MVMKKQERIVRNRCEQVTMLKIMDDVAGEQNEGNQQDEVQ